MRKIHKEIKRSPARILYGAVFFAVSFFLFPIPAFMGNGECFASSDTGLDASRPLGDYSSLYGRIFDIQPEKKDSSASLGLGMGWMRDMWGKENPGCSDSLEAFLEERKKVCIPNYSEPVTWEEDTRYTFEDSGCGTHMFRSKVKKGDTMGALFRAWLGKEEAAQAVKSLRSVFNLNRLRLGKVFSVERTAKDNKVLRLMYDIDDEHRLVVRRCDGGFKASVEVYEFDTKMIRVQGKISTSLFDAIAEAGEDASLADQIADVFSHQVNFLREVQEGDTFEVVVEKKFVGSQFRKYGDIIAARFINNGITYEAFRFFDDDGSAHYYEADGSSLETQFLKAPLNYKRISSKYSSKRKHPVLGRIRAHKGVDYAAPRGTPVMSLGDGAVKFIGWKGGYGKCIIISHKGGVETLYAHLSRYDKKLKKGDAVDQGQIVAFVGSTGLATGPHLHFEVIKNGKEMNPFNLRGAKSASIHPEKRRLFDNQVAQARLLLDGKAIIAVK